MKNLIKYTLAATLAVGAANASHHHQHRHAKKHASSNIEKRNPDRVTLYVAGPTATAYQLGEKVIGSKEAEEGLAKGEYVIVGESTPTFVPPPPPASTATSKDMKAQFIESKASTTTAAAATTTTSAPPPPPPPPSSSAKPAPPPSPKPAPPKPAAGSQESASTGATGLNADFPSGKIKCSQFPSQYGAVALGHLGLGGWSGLQFVPGYSIESLSISDIITGVSGQNCGPGCMCSYACPLGYQKAQWPAAQGSTKQSIGGVFCNSDGYLELTRPGSKKLCEAGVGGVSIRNELDVAVSTCRTDYPGTESMVIPAVAGPGDTIPLTNPNQDTYYQWQNMKTSAQYYVNKKGIATKDACCWNSIADKLGAGNWAPVILGVGQAGDGNTYISIFQNSPTSTALLDFNIEITGSVNSKCSYINGKWSGGSDGCTTAMPKGGQAVVRYF
ncbi:Secreted beta-glucosidase sun1 [Cladobotryum mycophilum]|uniref:Secreted beta-glucosidase sun1 n=1 Tax=Cladobotryum mycophilum TaxID=491253 RepID=A0ABR0S7A6_9HYPO